VTALAGLPITTPARTVLDLAAGGLRGRRLEAALDRAELLRLLDFAELKQLLARYPRRRETPRLVALSSRYVAGTVSTRSHLEELVLELCDAHEIARPTSTPSSRGTNATSSGHTRAWWSRPIRTPGTARPRR